MNRLAIRILCLAAVLTSLLVFTGSASAAVRRYVAHGTAQFVSPTDFVGSGIATRLGIYSETGSVVLLPTAIPTVFRAIGTATYEASNGDTLVAEIIGSLDMATGAISANLTYVGGTGRFENATGTSVLTGQLFEGGSMSVVVRGVLNN